MNMTIKSIETNKFFISLTETPSGLYSVRYNRAGSEYSWQVEMGDLKTAMAAFEGYLIELQGH